LIIWQIFFPFLQPKSSFCRLYAWSQLDFSAIPVSIPAVSLRRLSTYILIFILKLKRTWQNVNSKRRWQRIQNVQEGKRHQKNQKRDIKFLSFKNFKPTYQHLAAFFFVPSVFGEKFTTAEF
jgi:hypothetical protein